MTKAELLTCYNNSGFALFPLVGKVPAKGQKQWQKTPYDLGVDFENFPENFGVVLSNDILVIDVDPRNFDTNDKPHKRLFEDTGIEFSRLNTFVVETGTGGIHIYLRLPPGTPIKKKNKSYKGLDFLSQGCYVVGAGSVHPETTKSYKIIRGNLDEIKDAPETLISLLKANFDTASHIASRDYTDTKYDVETYIKYLTTEAPAAIEGNSGDATTYKVACQARNLGLSPELALQLLLDHYNPRCQPPWTPDDMMVKVRNAYTFAQGETGKDRPETHFTEIANENFADNIIRWDTTATGTKKKTLKNVVNCFLLPNSELKNCVGIDEFAGRLVILKKLPWHKKDTALRKGLNWSDNDSIECRYYLNQHAFDVPTKLIDEAIVVIGRRNRFHPVRDYMTNLVWDGEPRVDTWLIVYCGAADNRYTREISRIALLQLVKRVYQPGCKADHVLVLEGAQGVGKSTIIEILGGHWYADFIIDPHAMNTIDAMQGKLLIEFSEMDVTRKADVTALKAFITRRTDRVRLAYAKNSIDLPRQGTFMGSMNPDATNEYLADTTGNRRFLPVKLGVVNLGDLALDRDQLLAEAVQMVMRGVAIYIEDKEILELAFAEQQSRQFTDPWTGQIEDFLDTDELAVKYKFATTKDIWTSPLGLKGTSAQMTRFHSVRIHNVMKNLGWIYGTQQHPIKKKPTKAFRYYTQPEIEEKDECDRNLESLL